VTQWYKVTAYQNKDKVAEHGEAPAFLRQRFFDEHGEQLLVAIRMDSEGLPAQAIRTIVEAVTLTELSPTLLFGPHADLVRLEPLSEVESRRKETEYLRALRDAEEKEPSSNGAPRLDRRDLASDAPQTPGPQTPGPPEALQDDSKKEDGDGTPPA